MNELVETGWFIKEDGKSVTTWFGTDALDCGVLGFSLWCVMLVTLLLVFDIGEKLVSTEGGGLMLAGLGSTWTDVDETPKILSCLFCNDDVETRLLDDETGKVPRICSFFSVMKQWDHKYFFKELVDSNNYLCHGLKIFQKYIVKLNCIFLCELTYALICSYKIFLICN